MHRVLNKDAILGNFAQNEEPAAASFGDDRQSRHAEARPIAAHGAGFEFQILGAAQHLGDADVVPVLMRYLARISGDAMNAQQEHERSKARIVGGFG